MKKILLLILMAPLLVQAQYFSGEITYEIKIIPKSDTSNLDAIMSMKHGTTASYIITSKRYKSVYFKEGKYSYSYTYDDETKRMFDDYADRPYVTYRDSRRSETEYYGSTILKDSTLNILGHNCFMVVSEADFGTSKTYYADGIKVNYADFEGHKVGNWYDKLKEVDGSLKLKTITEYETHFDIQEAVKIESRKIKSKEFDLPDKPVAASFTALDKQVEMKQPTQDQILCYQQKVGAVSNPNGEKFTSYVSFLLQKDGQVKFVEPFEEDDSGLYKVAVDVVENCGFQFEPGMIQGEHVDSQVFFPVVFLK